MSLTIRRVSKAFPGSRQPNALRNIDIDVAEGELLVLLGPSGSGKTTLLRCIAGLIEPSQGTIKLGDRIVADCAAGEHIPIAKRDLGMVFQSFALWPHMTVAGNVAYPLKARKWGADAIRRRVDDMLALVHCSAFADRLPATLSGGQQQRVALARALAAKPAIVLFDEPLSNLDALLRVELRTQVRQIHRETGFTGVYVTHDQVEAMSLGDRVAVMNHGVIEQIGTPNEIYFHPRTEFVAGFMGMSNRVDAEEMAAGGPRGATAAGALRFRPESVQLLDGARGANASAEQLVFPAARVVDRAFHGERMHYVLAIGENMISAATEPRRIFEPGQPVTAVVPRHETCHFPAAPAQ
ncbi:MAG TPA: ABC transporter ATP-binding protein [Ramlibacter sp.]|nr:ABC transporter ATP-binding protein [Ramlibacter sp.]